MEKSSNVKRITAVILILALLAAVFSGCGETQKPNEETTAPVTAADGSETTEAETLYIDTLPNTDFNKRTFTIGAPAAYNLEPEDLTGETINDAVYYQMLQTEEKFNVDVKVADVSGDIVKASVAAGDNAFQIVTGGTSGFTSTYVLNGLVQNMYNFDYINFEMPWWNQNTVKELTLNNKLYLAYGDLCAERGITYTHSFFFNKELADDFAINDKIKELYGQDNIYDLVRSGKWTIDALETLISGVSVDVNGDSVMDFNDEYGLGQSIPVSGVYRTSFDCRIMDRDSDGWPVININSDKFNTILPRIYSLCFENEAVLIGEHAEEALLRDTFVEGRLLFYSGFLMDVNQLREMQNEFGVIPFPKYDEAQTDYYTTVRGDNYFVGIPTTVAEDDYSFVGLVTESLAYYGNMLVREAVYEDTLKGKMARDEDSVEMLDILTNGIIIEYAFAHANDKGFSYILWTMLNARMNSFSTIYNAKLKIATKYYDSLKEIYMNLD